jgi:anti-anti-sigma factor
VTISLRCYKKISGACRCAYPDLYLTVEFGVPRRLTIAESLTLTVSLRGTRDVRGHYQLFRLTGLLDAFSEPAFRKVMNKYVEVGPRNIILDLSGIDFVDSSGLGALVQLVKKTTTEKGTVQVVTNPRVTQTVKLVRLEKFLSLQPSVDDAIANLGKDNDA